MCTHMRNMHDNDDMHNFAWNTISYMLAHVMHVQHNIYSLYACTMFAYGFTYMFLLLIWTPDNIVNGSFISFHGWSSGHRGMVCHCKSMSRDGHSIRVSKREHIGEVTSIRQTNIKLLNKMLNVHDTCKPTWHFHGDLCMSLRFCCERALILFTLLCFALTIPLWTRLGTLGRKT